ncbi:MAG: hypothetical protein K0S26_1403 [Bacteroidota bacterium]|jgi:hypothetical protein|nr:hypothetical protein [Bacteroidota bacterium]
MKTKATFILVLSLFLINVCLSQSYLDKTQKQIVQEIYAQGQSSYRIIEQNDKILIFLQDGKNIVQFSFANGNCYEELWENSESITNSTKKLMAMTGYQFDKVSDGRPNDFAEIFTKDNTKAMSGWILKDGVKHWFTSYRHIR